MDSERVGVGLRDSWPLSLNFGCLFTIRFRCDTGGCGNHYLEHGLERGMIDFETCD
jgi:hypothetical protein